MPRGRPLRSGYWPDEQVHDQMVRAVACDAVVLAFVQQPFVDAGVEQIKGLAKPRHVLFDSKHVLPTAQVKGATLK